MIRCKFKCIAVEKIEGYGGNAFLYNAKFNVVYGDSPENKQFFASTPSGQITVGTVRESHFEVGKDYYVDFTEVK